MKRYRFRLDTVLRVRRVQEDIARGELRRAADAVGDAARRVEARAQHLGCLPVPTGRMETDAFLDRHRPLRAAAAAVLGARGELDGARAVAEARAVAWKVASARTKTLERLDERERVDHGLELHREEARDIDDLVVGARRRATANRGASR